MAKDLTKRKKKAKKKKRPCRGLKISWMRKLKIREEKNSRALKAEMSVLPVPVLPSTSGKVISPDPVVASVTGLRLASVTRFVSWSSKPPVASSLGEASFLTTAGDTVRVEV